MSWSRYLVIVAVLAMPWATLGVLQTTQGVEAQDASPATTQAQVRTQLDVTIPMRDGVRLAADIYRPEGTGPFSVLLSRTPYTWVATQSIYHDPVRPSAILLPVIP